MDAVILSRVALHAALLTDPRNFLFCVYVCALCSVQRADHGVNNVNVNCEL